MWGFERWAALRLVARGTSLGVALGALCFVGATNGLAQPKAATQPPAQQQPPQQSAKKPGHPPEADVCYGTTGADAPTKVAACTEVIDKGLLSGGGLALAYLHRGLSESGPDSDKRSKADFRTAV
ncbi:MAG: hypothetical protein Q8M69_01435, partial [Reyranella sp.]|nr:hypothetical protein [Reyranella sp.]